MTRKNKKTPAGAIPADWDFCRLKDVLEVRDERCENNGTHLLASLTIEKGLIPKPARYIREFLVKSKHKKYKVIHPKDIVFNPMNLRWGAICVAKLSQKAIASPVYQVLHIKNGARINLDFLENFFQTYAFKNIVNRFAEGTLIERTGVGIDDFMQFPIPVPSCAEQHKISNTINAIGENIDRTQMTIEQAQTLKKGLMHELFTHGLPGKHKSFKKTKIGEIPSDWEIVKLKELLHEPIRNGYSPNCPGETTGKWTLTLGAVTHEGFDVSGIKPAPLNDLRCLENTLLKGDLLVSRSNVRTRVGLAGVYEGNPKDCFYPDLLMRIRLNNSKVLIYWLEKWILSPSGRAYMEKNARGTSGSMVKIDRRILEDLPVPLPPLSEQSKILESIMYMQSNIYKNQELLCELKNIKAALAPALLTGKVRVNCGG